MESQWLCVAARMKVTRLSETLSEFEAIGVSEFIHCIWPQVSGVVSAVLLCHVRGNRGGCQCIHALCCVGVCMSNVLKKWHVYLCREGWSMCKFEHTCERRCVHLNSRVSARSEASRTALIQTTAGSIDGLLFLWQHCIRALMTYSQFMISKLFLFYLHDTADLIGPSRMGKNKTYNIRNAKAATGYWWVASLHFLFFWQTSRRLHVHFLPWFILTF